MGRNAAEGSALSLKQNLNSGTWHRRILALSQSLATAKPDALAPGHHAALTAAVDAAVKASASKLPPAVIALLK